MTQLYVRVEILLTCGEHWHDGIISLKGEVWVHKTSLMASLFVIEVPILCHESGRSCRCVLEVSYLHISTILG